MLNSKYNFFNFHIDLTELDITLNKEQHFFRHIDHQFRGLDNILDGIEQRGEAPTQNPSAIFASHELSLGLTYARRVTDNISLGLTSKYIYERFQHSVSALALDLALSWHIDFKETDKNTRDDLKLAFVLSNFGFAGKFDNEKVKLPTLFRIGAAYDLMSFRPSPHSMNLAVDFVKLLNDDFRTNLGAEYGYDEVYFLRFGYQLGYDYRGFSTGLGVVIRRNIHIDYSLTPFTDFLGTTQRVSFRLDF